MVEQKELMLWPEENIPDDAKLYYRVHKNLARGNQLGPNVFREQNGAMSSDWDRYSTAVEARERAAKPADNGIITLIAGTIRSINGLTLRHDPDHEKNNRAHTNTSGISGANKVRARSELSRHFDQWEIKPDQE